MAQKAGTFNYYKELPGWAKGFILIIFFVVLIFLLYTSYKGIKKAIDVAKAKGQLDKIDTDLKAYKANGVQPSYSDSQFQSWASSINQAFNGYGSNEQVIENIIMMLKKDIDVLKLIEAYGVRTITGGWLQDDFTGNLPASFTEEFSSYEIQDMNLNLKNNGISYQF